MIYCVEDDSAIRELMLYTLKAQGINAVGFERSADFWVALEKELPRLIMLDIMLPDEDGISILKRLKSSTKTAEIPVIMATAKSTEFDKVTGLDMGADDYLAKPFGMLEMVSRIKAVLRRTAPKDKPAILVNGGLKMDTERHTVFAYNEDIKLTLKEYELLQLFLTNLNKAFSREQLLVAVWGTDFMGKTRTVDVHIGTLRTKLKGCGNYIETVRGVGYRMGEQDE